MIDDLHAWLAELMEAELAENRRDLLYLYWEQIRYPETAQEVIDEIRAKADARAERLRLIWETLDGLADPSGKTLTDSIRFLSKGDLKRHDQDLSDLLAAEMQHVGASHGVDRGATELAVVETEPILIEVTGESGD